MYVSEIFNQFRHYQRRNDNIVQDGSKTLITEVDSSTATILLHSIIKEGTNSDEKLTRWSSSIPSYMDFFFFYSVNKSNLHQVLLLPVKHHDWHTDDSTIKPVIQRHDDSLESTILNYRVSNGIKRKKTNTSDNTRKYGEYMSKDPNTGRPWNKLPR